MNFLLTAATTVDSSAAHATDLLSISPTLQLIWFIIEVAGGIAFAIAYAKRGIAKNTIELQNEQIKVQKERIDTLEQEIERSERARLDDARMYKETIDKLESKTKELESSIRVIEGMKSGEDAIKSLGAHMEALANSNTAILLEIKQALTQIGQTRA